MFTSHFFNDYDVYPSPKHTSQAYINLHESLDQSEYNPSSLSDSDTNSNSTVETSQAYIKTRKHGKLLDMGSEEKFDCSRLPSHIVNDFVQYVVFCKRDWGKVSKKMFKNHGLKISAESLRNFYKSLEMEQKPRTKFSDEDDEKIFQAVNDHGKNWMLISQMFFSDACPLSVRNRYYHLLNKRMKEEKEKKRNSKVKAAPKKKKETVKIEEESVDLNILVTQIKLEEEPEWLTAINSFLSF